jgi:hypothetical protein
MAAVLDVHHRMSVFTGGLVPHHPQDVVLGTQHRPCVVRASLRGVQPIKAHVNPQLRPWYSLPALPSKLMTSRTRSGCTGRSSTHPSDDTVLHRYHRKSEAPKAQSKCLWSTRSDSRLSINVRWTECARLRSLSCASRTCARGLTCRPLRRAGPRARLETARVSSRWECDRCCR